MLKILGRSLAGPVVTLPSSIPVLRYDGPVFRLRWRHLLSVLGVPVGVAVLKFRADRLGREWSLTVFVVIGVVVVGVFGAMHVRRIRALYRRAVAGQDLLGVTMGGYEVAGVLRGGSRLVRTGVVGVLLVDGQLAAVVDRDGPSLLLPSGEVSLAIEARGSRYWFVIRTRKGDDSMRLFGRRFKSAAPCEIR